MTVVLERDDLRPVARIHQRAVMLASDLLTRDYAEEVAQRRREVEARREERVDNGVAPIVVFVVLIAFLALLAAAISIAVLIFCSQKGMNFEWMVKTSWFEVKVACRR